MRLQAYSEITDEVFQIGDEGDADALLELGGMMATNRDSLIVFATGPVPELQKWEAEG